ncbi:hypothetical protein AAFO92_08865 [Roseovarius sp. CAU 1744]|uniref:hypothetical protein n=1 Tax=Roseovarius sp. CAU 1744 TaxID=3140368 RepID=UPI00325B8D14
MALFPILLVALMLLGVLSIFSIEPARRTFLEGMAITVILGCSFVVAVVIYMALQALG